jgi:hypothetical protein
MNHRFGGFLAGSLLALAPFTAGAVEKFALIVGVDDQVQPATQKISVLRGPTNDVKLMRRLLVEQYGFRDDDAHILTITGNSATRKRITDAFRTQLIENAKLNKDAVVVFYFSGHGSQQDDLNNDEGDGLDETLVAYDSRGPGGQDIVDDEINDWFQSLAAHTKNAVFLLDSCHSGTGTRGDAEARQLPTNPNAPRNASPAGGLTREPSPGWATSDHYTAVAGSLADEQSYEGPIKAAKGLKYGYMTWSLYQTLSLQPQLSWRQAIEAVREGVGQFTSRQHPQVEGDLDRTAFGEFGDRSQPHLSITSVTSTTLSINGGQAQGLAEGSVLAIYDPSAKLLVGDRKKLATARVTAAGLATSQAVFVDKPAAQLPKGAKVTIVTPYFGTAPLPVAMNGLADQPTTASDRSFLEELRGQLSKSNLVLPTKATAPWRYAVQKGCLADDNRLVVPKRGQAVNCSRAAYYLAGPQTLEPALGYWVDVTDPGAAKAMADAVTGLARQAALRALSNRTSELDVTIKLVPVKVTMNSAGELEAINGQPIPASRQASLNLGDAFRFEINNRSNKDVWVTVLALGTGGGINVLTPAKTGDKVAAHQTFQSGAVLEARPPAGMETYKLIATTRPGIDFSVLESPSTTRKAGSSALQWFLEQAASTTARNTGSVAGVQLSEWTTVNLDVLLRPAPGK